MPLRTRLSQLIVSSPCFGGHVGKGRDDVHDRPARIVGTGDRASDDEDRRAVFQRAGRGDDALLVADGSALGPNSGNDEKAVWPGRSCLSDFRSGADDPVDSRVAGDPGQPGDLVGRGPFNSKML